MTWTRKKLLTVYAKAFPDDAGILLDPEDYGDCGRGPMIAGEMKAIIRAKTLEEAKGVIEWWHDWEPGELARTVRRIQRIARRTT